LVPEKYPVNDGGLSMGQAVIVAARDVQKYDGSPAPSIDRITKF